VLSHNRAMAAGFLSTPVTILPVLWVYTTLVRRHCFTCNLLARSEYNPAPSSSRSGTAMFRYPSLLSFFFDAARKLDNGLTEMIQNVENSQLKHKRTDTKNSSNSFMSLHSNANSPSRRCETVVNVFSNLFSGKVRQA
jgi:hypothetical protein